MPVRCPYGSAAAGKGSIMDSLRARGGEGAQDRWHTSRARAVRTARPKQKKEVGLIAEISDFLFNPEKKN